LKTIGLIGGMSWESSAEYYRIINQTVGAELGGLHSAKCVLVSVDFAEIEELQNRSAWGEAAQRMAAAAQRLESAGADCVVLCTNTMHKLADEIQAGIHIPFLHIADATAKKVVAAGIRRVGLLGTRYTMEENFYKGRLAKEYGLDVIIPDSSDREIVHGVIFNELCLGIAKPESRDQFIRIMTGLVGAGAEGIILGCTELELLVRAEDSSAPLFPTAKIHALAAVEYALTQ
jgi:aspartate racemase